MKKEVKCKSCGKKIRDRGNVNIRFFLGVKPEINCNNCYDKKIKTNRKYLFGYSPWRGLPFNIWNNKKFLIGLMGCSFILIVLIMLYRINYGLIPRYIEGVLIVSILLNSWYWVMFGEAKKIVKQIK